MIAILGCKGCGTCSEVCPIPEAIIRNCGKVVKIDDSKCIKCYKCVEKCPYKAYFDADIHSNINRLAHIAV